MASIKWIKLDVNIFDDEKVKIIRKMPEGDAITLVWIQLICMAGKVNDGGAIYVGQNIPYTDEMLATVFDQPLNVIKLALKTFITLGMLDQTAEGMFYLENWEKHQSTDKMAQIKEQNKLRQQKYYYRNKLRELGIPEHEMPTEVEELKKVYDNQEKPNVSNTLANEIEVRSKKLEVRSKNSIYSPAKAEQEIPYKDIVDYLNDKAKKNYKHSTKKTQSLIDARFKDGFNLDDFKKVIDNKVIDWMNDSNMNKYLRPETLFGTKFEGYLNEQKIQGNYIQGRSTLANSDDRMSEDERLAFVKSKMNKPLPIKRGGANE